MNPWIQKLISRLPAVCLLAATLLFWGFYDRFESAGPVLLNSPGLSAASRVRGNCSEAEGHFILSVIPEGKTARLNIRMPGAAEYDRLRIRGRIKVDGVEVGRYRWSCARMLLAQYDSNNEWLPGHHTLKAEKGTHDWAIHEQVFDIQPEAAHVDISLQHLGRSGTAEFDQLAVEPVRLRPSFVWWRSLFAILWLAMGILFFRRCRLDRRKLRVLILLNAIAILSGSMMPEKWIEGVTGGLKQLASKTVSTADKEAPKSAGKSHPVREREGKAADVFNAAVGTVHQAGHFLLFASLCFLMYLSAALERQHPSYFFKVAFDLLLFASITESLQYLTLDRTPGITDWRTDIYGMLTAFLLFLIFLGMRRIALKARKYIIV